jgi:hypothetical protein
MLIIKINKIIKIKMIFNKYKYVIKEFKALYNKIIYNNIIMLYNS